MACGKGMHKGKGKKDGGWMGDEMMKKKPKPKPKGKK